MTRKKILLVTFLFPPCGGPGVQRNLKFGKYLPNYGIDVFILTVKKVLFYTYDEKLLTELPAENTQVIRTNSLDPQRISWLLKSIFKKSSAQKADKPIKSTAKKSIDDSGWLVKVYRWLRDRFLFPDGANGWIPFALIKGWRVIRQKKIEVLVGSYPGPSNALITYILSKVTRVPYILDFRDGYLDYPYITYPSSFHKWMHARLEKLVVTNASKIVTFGPFLTNRLKDRYGLLDSTFSEISNGFDPDDFKHLEKNTSLKKADEKYRVVHLGNIFLFRKDCFESLVKGFLGLDAEVKKNIVFDLIGNFYQGAKDIVANLGLEEHFIFHGYMDHKKSLAYLVNSDACLILLPENDFAAVTGKIFEYLAVEKPILLVGEPEGGCGQLISKVMDYQTIAHPSDTNAIQQLFINLNLNNWKGPSTVEKNSYSRVSQSGHLAEILKSI